MSRLVLVLALLASTPARAHTLELSAGGAWMANLHNTLRVGATDLQLGWRHDFAWSSVAVGAEWLAFFPAEHVDPAIGARLGWSVHGEVAGLRPRAGVGVGLYWTHVSPILPIGYLDLSVEKAFAPWSVGVAIAGMYSLFGAGVQPRLFVARSL